MQSVEKELWKSAVIPATIVGLIGLLIVGLTRGSAGILGGLVAQGIVLGFFAVHLIISKISRNLDPIRTMVLAMFSYFLKVIILGVILVIMIKTTDQASLDRRSFGAVAIAITLAWLAGEIRAFLKLELHLPLPKKE